MGPTEVNTSGTDANLTKLKKEEDVVGCEVFPKEETAEGDEPSTSGESTSTSTANEPTPPDLESDGLICLFKLAVIFTRGNPFNSRKHFCMKSEFLAAKMKIESNERFCESDEDELNQLDADASTSISSSEPPKVRQVSPCHLDSELEGGKDTPKTGEVVENKLGDGSASCDKNLDDGTTPKTEQQIKGELTLNDDNTSRTEDRPSPSPNTFAPRIATSSNLEGIQNETVTSVSSSEPPKVRQVAPCHPDSGSEEDEDTPKVGEVVESKLDDDGSASYKKNLDGDITSKTEQQIKGELTINDDNTSRTEDRLSPSPNTFAPSNATSSNLECIQEETVASVSSSEPPIVRQVAPCPPDSEPEEDKYTPKAGEVVENKLGVDGSASCEKNGDSDITSKTEQQIKGELTLKHGNTSRTEDRLSPSPNTFAPSHATSSNLECIQEETVTSVSSSEPPKVRQVAPCHPDSGFEEDYEDTQKVGEVMENKLDDDGSASCEKNLDDDTIPITEQQIKGELTLNDDNTSRTEDRLSPSPNTFAPSHTTSSNLECIQDGTVASVSSSEPPKVRFIQVAPCHSDSESDEDEDTPKAGEGVVENRLGEDGLASCDSDITPKIEQHIKGEMTLNHHNRSRTEGHTTSSNLECIKRERVASVSSTGPPKVRFIQVAPCHPDSDSEEDGDIPKVGVVVENKLGDGHASCEKNLDSDITPKTKNEQPGCFTKAIRRFLRFFRRNRVGVAPTVNNDLVVIQ